MPKIPSSSVDPEPDENDNNPIRQWLLDERARYEAQQVARAAARVSAGRRVWWILAARGWWVLVLPLLVLAGCAGNATPQIVREEVPVTVVVERTIERTVEVTREVTRVITATPTPRPTATPAPTAAPTPVVAVPAGWITYTHPAGVFTVSAPAGTRAANEGEAGSLLTFPDGGGVVILLVAAGAGTVGNEADIDALVQAVLSAENALDTVRVLDRGSWTTPVPANYAELAITDYVYKTTSYNLHMEVPIGRASYFAVNLLTRHRATDADKAQLGTILTTLRAGR